VKGQALHHNAQINITSRNFGYIDISVPYSPDIDRQYTWNHGHNTGWFTTCCLRHY